MHNVRVCVVSHFLVMSGASLESAPELVKQLDTELETLCARKREETRELQENRRLYAENDGDDMLRRLIESQVYEIDALDRHIAATRRLVTTLARCNDRASKPKKE